MAGRVEPGRPPEQSPRGGVRRRRGLGARLKAYWMAFALRLGEIQTQIVLTVMYVLVFGSANMILRALGKDLLGKRVRSDSYWVPHERQPETLERFRHPF
jgi:hypothetical protein